MGQEKDGDIRDIQALFGDEDPAGWKAFRQQRKERRQARHARDTAAAEAGMAAAGLGVVRVMNNGHHWRVRRAADGRLVDWWPASGLWRETGTRGAMQTGGWAALVAWAAESAGGDGGSPP